MLTAHLLLAVVLAQAATDSESLSIQLLPPRDVKLSAQSGATLIVEECLDAECRATQHLREVPVRWNEPLTLPSSAAALRISTVEGVWLAPTIATPGQSLILRSWPMASVDVELEGDRGESAPSKVLLRVSGEDLPDAEVQCRQTEGQRWTCRVPAGRVDLRLQAGDFVPHYFWGVAPTAAAPESLGKLRLRRGASIIGRIVAAERDLRDLRVHLVPKAGRTSDSAEREPLIIAPNHRGTFQFVGVSIGAYDVVVTRKDEPVTGRVSISATEPREYAIEPAFEMAAQVSFDILVSPPVAPSGKQWQIRLDRTRAEPHLETVAKGQSDASGVWTVDAVPEGRYLVSVDDPTSGIRQRKDLELTARTSVVHVPVDLISVRGEVVAGDHGVRGTLKLSYSDGSSLKFTTDDDGRFEGHATREGTWRVEVMPDREVIQLLRTRKSVEIKRRDDGAPVAIRIELPEGRLHGKVADEQGRPVTAFVYVNRAGRGLASAKTAPDGTFEIIGLEPGPVSVEANTRTEESGAIEWEVEKEGRELRLTVASNRKVRGSVRSPEGAPIAGALIRYFGGAIGDLRETSSNPQGGFSLTVPKSAGYVSAVVLVPGFPVRITRLDVRSSAAIDIILGRAIGKLLLTQRRVPPWPAIRPAGGELVPLRLLMDPSSFKALQFDLEPGVYTICPGLAVTPPCVDREIERGSEVTVDTRAWFEP